MGFSISRDFRSTANRGDIMNITSNPYVVSRIIELSCEDRDLVEGVLSPDNDAEAVESLSKNLLPHLQSGKRYRFSSGVSYKERVVEAVFEKSFALNPQEVLDATQSSASPLWERVVFIEAPRSIAYVCDSTVVKVGLCAAFCFAAMSMTYSLYEQLPVLIAPYIPIIVKYTPIQLIQAGNYIADKMDWVIANPYTTMFYAWIAQRILVVVGEGVGLPEPYQGYIERFSVQSLIPGTTSVFWLGYEFCSSNVQSIWNGCEETAGFFNNIADKAERESLVLGKKHAYAVWKEAVANIPREEVRLFA